MYYRPQEKPELAFLPKVRPTKYKCAISLPHGCFLGKIIKKKLVRIELTILFLSRLTVYGEESWMVEKIIIG